MSRPDFQPLVITIDKLELPKSSSVSGLLPTQNSPLKDMKLSIFNKLNDLNKNTEVNKPCCKFSFFYVYTIFILGVTLLVAISPKTANIVVETIVKFCVLTATVPEPLRSFVYLAIFYMHQFLGIPLQTVSVMLVTFSLKQFWHGYLLVCIANISSSAVFYLLFKKCLRKYMEKKYKDNIFVSIIKEESAKNPIKVSFLFRFMNIPGLYKNVGLGISEYISFFWFIIPSAIEAAISNGFICFLGSVMTHGLEVLNPKGIASKAKHTKVLFSVSYGLLAVQFLCIGMGVIVTLLKIRKIRRIKILQKTMKWRTDMCEKGYVHDIDTDRKLENPHHVQVYQKHGTFSEDHQLDDLTTISHMKETREEVKDTVEMDDAIPIIIMPSFQA